MKEKSLQAEIRELKVENEKLLSERLSRAADEHKCKIGPQKEERSTERFGLQLALLAR